MSDLLRVTRGWLLTNISTLSILDKGVLDHFLQALPHDMKRAASLCVPQTLEGVETHQNTQALLSGSQAESAIRLRSRKDIPTAVYPWRDGWGRADLPPTTPGRWRPKVF
jgi:hypothetical protein